MSNAPPSAPSSSPLRRLRPHHLDGTSKPGLRSVPSSGPSSEPSTGPSTSPSGWHSLLAQPSSLPWSKPSLSNVPSSAPSSEPSTSERSTSLSGWHSLSAQLSSSSPSSLPSVSSVPSSDPSTQPSTCTDLRARQVLLVFYHSIPACRPAQRFAYLSGPGPSNRFYI